MVRGRVGADYLPAKVFTAGMRLLRDLAAAEPTRARRMYERMIVRDNGGRALPSFA